MRQDSLDDYLDFIQDMKEELEKPLPPDVETQYMILHIDFLWLLKRYFPGIFEYRVSEFSPDLMELKLGESDSEDAEKTDS